LQTFFTALVDLKFTVFFAALFTKPFDRDTSYNFPACLSLSCNVL